MEDQFLNLTEENLDREHLCCIIRSKKPHPGVEAKRVWLREWLREGHVFRKLDANILSGQIKNSLDFRLCGKVDNALSQIILDNTNAADQVPKDARGRFITGDGMVFQDCLFDAGQF